MAHRLPAQASGLARAILDGAQDAFVTPMNQACVVLGAVLLAGAAVLLWLAPRRVVAVTDTDIGTGTGEGEPVTGSNEFGWADGDRQRSTER